MPRGGIYRLKKSHDLEIGIRPTCRDILGDGILKKKKFQPEVIFSNLQTSKYIFLLEVCIFEKKNSGLNFFCCEYHLLENRDR